VSGRTSADVDALDAYTRRTLGALPPVRAAIDRYRVAWARVIDASSDVVIDLDDRSAALQHRLDLLDHVDRLPAAFAAALRDLDQDSVDRMGAASTGQASGSDTAVAMLAHAEVAAARDLDPVDPRDDALAALRLPRDARDTAAWDAVGLAADTAEQVALHGNGAVAQRLRTLRVVSGPMGFVLTPAIQYLDDRSDPTLTTGDRVVGIAATTVYEGVGGAAGAAKGRVLTAGIVRGAGLGSRAGKVGLIAGGIVGGVAGSRHGEAQRNRRSAVEQQNRVARRVDRVLGTGHRDGYAERYGVSDGRR
jgi:hypothetical protein